MSLSLGYIHYIDMKTPTLEIEITPRNFRIDMPVIIPRPNNPQRTNIGSRTLQPPQASPITNHWKMNNKFENTNHHQSLGNRE